MKTIETERLLLRSFRMEDAKAIHTLFCDSEAMRYVGMYPPVHDYEQSIERVEGWRLNDGRLAITQKDTGILMGYITINEDSEEEREDTKELGFAMISGYRKKGYMKEAATAVLSYLRQQHIHYVWACCFKENMASESLIRSIGFEFQKEGSFNSKRDQIYKTLEFRMDLSKPQGVCGLAI